MNNDVVKIKIGSNVYNIKDVVVRNWISGDGENDFEQQVKNIIKYGIPDISGKTQEEIDQLEEEQQSKLFTELDPVFKEHIANKLIGTVDANGILTLISE